MKKLHISETSPVKEVEKRESSKKKDVNLQNNSSLYFQLGLILCLLGTYGLFQMEFEKTMPSFAYFAPLDDQPPVFFIRETPTPPEEPVKKREPQQKVAVLTDSKPIIVDNNSLMDVPDVVIHKEVEPKISTPKVTTPVTPVTPAKEWNMKDVEKVPVFPGCESATSNEERMACMSEKLTKHIQKKFNTNLAGNLGLSGIQKIQVQFKIDDTGHVTDIKTRSPYSELEKEAERVVSKIPVMTPGMQRNTPVSVVYYLPISFEVN